MAVKKKVAKKAVKKKPVTKKKPVRGTTKKTVGKAKLVIEKQEPSSRPPRIGQVILFTTGEGRKMKFGLGFSDSAVGEVVNVRVGDEKHGRWVHVTKDRTYKPLATEKSLNDFLCESIRIAYEAGFAAGEHSALGKTHSAVEKALEAVDAQPAVQPSNDPDNDIAIANLKKAEAVLNNGDDLSILYAAFAAQPKAQQVVERAEDVLNDNSKEEAVAAVHEEQTEEQKLEVIREVQKPPLL